MCYVKRDYRGEVLQVNHKLNHEVIISYEIKRTNKSFESQWCAMVIYPLVTAAPSNSQLRSRLVPSWHLPEPRVDQLHLTRFPQPMFYQLLLSPSLLQLVGVGDGAARAADVTVYLPVVILNVPLLLSACDAMQRSSLSVRPGLLVINARRRLSDVLAKHLIMPCNLLSLRIQRMPAAFMIGR